MGVRESLKCLGKMIWNLYNNNQDPELDCCVGELYRMSMVCFLRTTLTPPGRFSVSPFLKDNCTSDFPNWAFNLKGKNPLFRLKKLVSYKCMHHFTLTFFTRHYFEAKYFIMNVNTSLFLHQILTQSTSNMKVNTYNGAMWISGKVSFMFLMTRQALDTSSIVCSHTNTKSPFLHDPSPFSCWEKYKTTLLIE